MRMVVRLISAAALAGVGVWLWLYLHPSPEKVIRARFAEIARSVSVTPNDGNLSRMAAARGLADSFTRDAEVFVEVPNARKYEISGRDEIFFKASGATTGVAGMKVEFLDLNISIGPDRKTAEVELTAMITFANDSDIVPQELKCVLIQIDGEWLISRVETVRVLK